MRKLGKLAGFAILLIIVLSTGGMALAQAGGAAGADGGGIDLSKMGAGLGAGLIAIGAGMGIGRFAAAAAEGIARQPSAASAIVGAVNLPLFLLEGVAIIGLVVCLLVVFLS